MRHGAEHGTDGPPSSLPSTVRRVLVVRAGALGDTILALPAIRALRRATGSGGEVEFLGTMPQAHLALDASHASRVHAFDRSLFREFFVSGTAAEELAGFLSRYDLVVSWARLPRLRELASGAIIDASPNPPPGVHATDHLLASLGRLGGDTSARIPTLGCPAAASSEAESFLDDNGLSGAPFVAVHPSSGSPSKNWPAERFRALAASARRSGLSLLWIEGEADGPVVEPLASAVPAPTARRLELRVLAAVLARAALYVGNDSGVSHLAAAVGAPTLALFGPTDAARWAPRGARVHVVNWHVLPDVMWGIALKTLKLY